MPGKQRVQISVQIEEDYLESVKSPRGFGFGSAGFLRHNRLDVEFLSGVWQNGNIDTTSPRSRDQHIDELAYSIITGEEAPQPPSPKNRRSRSQEPRRVNQESLTLEDRMGPKARFRVRSNGWRPLRSIGGEGKKKEALPPTTPAPRQEALDAREATGFSRGISALDVREATGFSRGISALDVREATGFSQGISDECVSMISRNNSVFTDRSPTGASCSQDSDVPRWGRRQSYVHEPYCTPLQAYPECLTPSAKSMPSLVTPSAKSSVPSSPRSFTGESTTTTTTTVRPVVAVSSFGTQPVRAWRYGRGSWYSVMECTVELQDATVIVKREGVVQQGLSCKSITQAVKYGAQKRLIIAAGPGEDSMFLSLDKEVESLLFRAFAHYGIPVSTAGYMEFHAVQKDLTFPGAPLFEAPPKPKPKAPWTAQADQAPPKPKAPWKSTVPTQVPKQGGATSNAAGVQAEISAQLNALRSQQQELARLEAQLLQLRTVTV